MLALSLFFFFPPSSILKRPRRLDSPFAAATQLSHIERQDVKDTLPEPEEPARLEDEDDDVCMEPGDPNLSLKVFRRQSSSSSQ
jgi:hypothetical protein